MSLLIEAEVFSQPSLRAKRKKDRGSRPQDIQGFAVDEHVALLRDRLMPLVERFQRLGRDSIEVIGRMRRAPSLEVEQSGRIEVVLASSQLPTKQ